MTIQAAFAAAQQQEKDNLYALGFFTRPYSHDSILSEQQLSSQRVANNAGLYAITYDVDATALAQYATSQAGL